MNSILVPPSFFEVCMPLPICVAPLMKALGAACPEVPISVVEETEFGIIIRIGDIYIFCARHCSNPDHSCIMVSIWTTIVPYKDQETTPDYIHRVVALVVKQLNLQALMKLVESLHLTTTYHVVIENGKIQLMAGDFTPDSTTATIQGGSLIHCGIPLKTNVQPNLALMAQFLKIIELSSADTVYVRIQATQNGFVSLHEHEGKKLIFLSYKQGISTKLVVEGIQLFDIENFLKKPTDNLAVIHTTGTPYAGVVGHLELATSTFADIRIGKESIRFPESQWSYLKNIL